MDIQQVLKQLGSAFAANTLCVYRADFIDFEAWCKS
jgi:hypothetical protein